MKRSRKKSCLPTKEVQEHLVFNAFLLPIYSREWFQELTSAEPRWMYLGFLHRRMLELEETL